MALTETIVNQIRDEIGPDQDFTDANLEVIYTDENRGNYSVLVTALIVWRNRLYALQARGFDMTAEGSLLNRSQRTRQIQGHIQRLEMLVDDTYKGKNMYVTSPLDAFGNNRAEFSA